MDLSHLGALLRTRHVPRVLLASLISRLATGMFALSILMAVLRSGGSYFLASTTLFAHAIALAASAPLPAAWRIVSIVHVKGARPPMLHSHAARAVTNR